MEYNGGIYHETDSGRVRQIIPHPVDPRILYLSASGGGVWKTYDAGASWEPLGDKLGALSIGTLAMDPASPEVLYLGFGDFVDDAQPGMVKSLDGGATWTAAQTLTATYTIAGVSRALVADRVMDIKIDPLNSLLVLVATNEGLFRSINAGDSYAHVALPGVDGNGASVADGPYFIWSIAYAGPHTWVVTGQRHSDPSVTTDKGGDLGLWRSTDDGGHFTYLPGAIPNAEGGDVGRATLAAAASTVDDAATSRIFMLASNLAGLAQKDVYRSDDGGQSWIKLNVNDSRKPTNPNTDQPNLTTTPSSSTPRNPTWSSSAACSPWSARPTRARTGRCSATGFLAARPRRPSTFPTCTPTFTPSPSRPTAPSLPAPTAASSARPTRAPTPSRRSPSAARSTTGSSRTWSTTSPARPTHGRPTCRAG